MKTAPKTLRTVPLTLILAACGGGGGTSPADNGAPANTLANTRENINLSTVQLAPTRAAQPDADTRAQIDIALAETNRLRAAAGRPPLQADQSLAAYAAVRAQESATLFSHNRPNGQVAGDYSLFNRTTGSVIGENLQKGVQDPKGAIEYLRNSSGHYRNIIETGYGKIGIGYHQSGAANGHYWAQIFTDPNTTSKFRFITPLSHAEGAQAIQNAVSYRGDTLHLTGLRDQALSLGSGIYAAPYVHAVKTDHRIVLRPGQEAGWSYQTFGEIIDDSRIPEAYFNVGKTYIPQSDTILRAQYRGKAAGDLGQHSRVLADVSASVDFSANAKTLNLTLHNSMRAARDLERGASTVFGSANALDFSDTLQWNSERGRFESETGSARLYGPNAEELGGQFARQISGENYRGAYGANRVAGQ